MVQNTSVSPCELPAICEVCGENPDVCRCPLCDCCGEHGNPDCFKLGHDLPHRPDSVRAFLDYVGIEPLHAALRAIEKYNAEHIYLVMRDGRRLYYWSNRRDLDAVEPWEVIAAVGVAGIAWDSSDWEWATEVPLGADGAENNTYSWQREVDHARRDFEAALRDWLSSKTR